MQKEPKAPAKTNDTDACISSIDMKFEYKNLLPNELDHVIKGAAVAGEYITKQRKVQPGDKTFVVAKITNRRTKVQYRRAAGSDSAKYLKEQVDKLDNSDPKNKYFYYEE